MSDEGMREYLTIQQVADYLSIKSSSLYSKIAEIPHYRIGRLLRFRKGEMNLISSRTWLVSTMVLMGDDLD